MTGRPAWLPGDPHPRVDRMVRVDHAGEYGAARIYAGQLAAMGGRHPHASLIRHMAEQEARHLATFDRLVVDRGVAPTILHPLWHVAGYALGAITALIGPQAAMACTAAVETEIDRHYAAQRATLGEAHDPDLSSHLADFQADEIEHRDTAIAHDAERAVGFAWVSAAIRAGCRAAIAVSSRI